MKHNHSLWLNEQTWEEVAQYLKKDDSILFPVGATEEHGPAGPLGLDTYVAIALAQDVAQKTKTLVAPPLWFGDSSHHLGFAGTISLRTETLIAVIRDMALSVARHGFRKIIIINGHKSANLPGLLTAAKSLHEHELSGVFFAVIDPMKIAKGIAAKIKREEEHHAGELEISHVWYKFPSLIRANKLPKQKLHFAEIFSPYSQYDLFGKVGEVIDIPWNSFEQRHFTPTGSFSDSSGASRKKGKLYHDYMVNVIVDFIGWLRRYKGPIGNVRANVAI